MSYEFFPDNNLESVENLNREINDLYEEVEDLHGETGMLTGLMAGSFAYFSKFLLAASRDDKAITPKECEDIWLDAVKRVISTQQKFDYDLVKEIRSTIGRMNDSEGLLLKFDRAIADIQKKSQH